MFLCIYNAGDRHVIVGCLFKKACFLLLQGFSLYNLYFSIKVLIYSITVSQLAGILSPVNHKWLHQGEKQCSVCLLFTLHANYQNTHYPKMTKSVRTQIYRKHTNIKHKIFKELVPSVLTLLKKKHIRLGHAGIVDHAVDLSIPD